MTDASASGTHAALVEILKRSKGEPAAAFSEPWMARAFALVLALSEKGLFSLKEFQAALIESVDRHEKAGCITAETDYYTRWLEALTALLRGRHILSDEVLTATEAVVVAVAAARKDHQHQTSRNPDGTPRIAPLLIA
jgi:nitrile hydratase accessory protein